MLIEINMFFSKEESEKPFSKRLSEKLADTTTSVIYNAVGKAVSELKNELIAGKLGEPPIMFPIEVEVNFLVEAENKEIKSIHDRMEKLN